MHIAVLGDDHEGERRVALTPTGVERLIAAEHSITIEQGAGIAAGFSDDAYVAAGARVSVRADALRESGVVVSINRPAVADLRGDHTVIAMLDPLWAPDTARDLAASGATLISLELVPRITRAQSMDVLSSMATVAGTQAVLLAALESPKMMPLMMTAAGTVPAARVLVLGAGVAGLQAIATARRLGAVVEGYDIRPAAAEQIRSLGARAVELELDTIDQGDDGGYARQQDDDTAARMQALLASHVAEADVLITTAAIPGAASPLLVTDEMVASMRRGAVIVDMAAERGGNCAPTRLDERIEVDGVIVLGPSDLASRAATSASEMLSTNIANLVDHLTTDGELVIDLDDEITAGIVIARGGELIDERILDMLQTSSASQEPTP